MQLGLRKEISNFFTPIVFVEIKNVIALQRYSHKAGNREDAVDPERASSAAEKSKKAAEEKLRSAKQGVASQTIEKAQDAGAEATVSGGESPTDSFKNRLKVHEDGADYHRKDGGPEGVKTQGG